MQKIEAAIRDDYNTEDVQLLIRSIEDIMLSLSNTDTDILNKIDAEYTAVRLKEIAMSTFI
jgi:hypothetical protein